MNFTLQQSPDIIERVKLLEPHYGIFNFSRLGEFDKAISLPDTAVSVLSNYISFNEEELEEECA
jgi:hypothetical protein